MLETFTAAQNQKKTNEAKFNLDLKTLKQKYDEKCKELLGYKILEKFNNHKKDKLIK